MSLLLNALKELQAREAADQPPPPTPTPAPPPASPTLRATIRHTKRRGKDRAAASPDQPKTTAEAPNQPSLPSPSSEEFSNVQWEAAADALESHVATVDVPPQSSLSEVIVVDSPLQDDILPGDGDDLVVDGLAAGGDSQPVPGFDAPANPYHAVSTDVQATQATLLSPAPVDNEPAPATPSHEVATDWTARWESQVETILQEIEEHIEEAALDAEATLAPARLEQAASQAEALPDKSAGTSHDAGEPEVAEASAVEEIPLVIRPDAYAPSQRPATEYEQRISTRLGDPSVRRQYQEMLDNITGLLPSDLPAVVAVVGTEFNEHIPDVVAHLGQLMAQRESRRILLVDANLTEKSLTEHLQLRGEAGLADALNQDQSWRRLVAMTSTPRLHVLAGGRGLADMGTDLSRLASLIEDWKGQYGYVLIDAGSVHGPLANALARTCDATFLVVQLRRSDVAEADRAARRLRRAGGRLLGCIVTNAPAVD